jgi:hydrogenase maturation protease
MKKENKTMISDDVMELQKLFYQTYDYLNSEQKNRILVLGIGNYLMGDEGVGVHVIHALSKINLPDYVDLIDGGTGSFDLMPIIAQYSIVFFIDATMDMQTPGTIDVLYPEFAADFPTVLSAHDVGLKDMIDALEFNEELPRIILLTVSIKDMIPMTIKLTPKVQKAIPKVVDRIVNIVNEIKINI